MKIINALYLKFGLLLLTVILSSYAQAQDKNTLLKIAHNEFMNENYFESAQYYEQVFHMDASDLFVVHRLCESYRLGDDLITAEKYYDYLMTYNDAVNFPNAFYYRGKIKFQLGKFKESILVLDEYLTLSNRDSMHSILANKLISLSNDALHILGDTLNVQIEHLDRAINTYYSEFNPVLISKNQMIYCSLRPILKSEFSTMMEVPYQSKLYISKFNKGGWSIGQQLTKPFNYKNAHVAHVCFDDKKENAFISKCYDIDGETVCSIYRSQKHNEKWGKAVKLNKNINAPNSSNTQAYWVNNGKTTILYFVSNRKNGFGKMDIYYSVETNGEFKTVSNLGNMINTPGNEITPYYDIKNNLLYFSSDSLKRLGGYDIYRSKGGFNQWEKPKNMGFPLNSAQDDVYFTPFDSSSGYFSSNRSGSYFHDITYCCNDIYRYDFALPPPIIETDSIPEITIAEKINQLLPLNLYFHNDIPNPRSTDSTTKVNYSSTVYNYITLKEKYKKEYSRSLSGIKKKEAEAEIDTFFSQEVETSYENLDQFCKMLLEDLKNGNRISIKIKGYASPLNTSKYNKLLSKRRIGSFINYINAYQNGVFVPFLNSVGENTPELQFIESPMGEEPFSGFVSDNPNDKRNSIYSISAANSRKIQIFYYDSKQQSETDILRSFVEQKSIHDFGILTQHKKAQLTYKIENDSDTPIRIDSIIYDANLIAIEEIPDGKGGKHYRIQLKKPYTKTNYQEKIRFISYLPQKRIYMLEVKGELEEKQH